MKKILVSLMALVSISAFAEGRGSAIITIGTCEQVDPKVKPFPKDVFASEYTVQNVDQVVDLERNSFGLGFKMKDKDDNTVDLIVIAEATMVKDGVHEYRYEPTGFKIFEAVMEVTRSSYVKLTTRKPDSKWSATTEYNCKLK